MARAYLGRPEAVSRFVVVAGEQVCEAELVCQGLQRAARGLGIPSVRVRRDREDVDVELAHDRLPPLVVYQHGRVRETQLSSLPSPDGVGPDLLLWLLPPRDTVALRSIYLLSMWIWSLRPLRLRCLWPSPNSGKEAIAHRTRAELERGLRRGGVRHPVELLAHGGDWRSPEAHGLLTRVVHSLLAGSPSAATGHRDAKGTRLSMVTDTSAPQRAADTPRAGRMAAAGSAAGRFHDVEPRGPGA